MNRITDDRLAEKYRKYEIEIHSQTDFSSWWVEINNSRSRRSEEVLVVPHSAIRIIKILTAPEQPAHTLMRPAVALDAEE